MSDFEKIAFKDVSDQIRHQEALDELNPGAYRKDRSLAEMVAYITAYAGRAVPMERNERQGETPYRNLVKVAALAIVALEELSRAEAMSQFGLPVDQAQKLLDIVA